jgi:hypothetical protein
MPINDALQTLASMAFSLADADVSVPRRLEGIATSLGIQPNPSNEEPLTLASNVVLYTVHPKTESYNGAG